MINLQAMIETLDAIDTGVVEWEQSNWLRCFAGNVMRLQGFPPYLRRNVDDEGYGWVCMVNLPEEGEVNIHDAARDFLGLTESQARILFHGGNNSADVHRIVEELVQDELARQAAMVTA